MKYWIFYTSCILGLLACQNSPSEKSGEVTQSVVSQNKFSVIFDTDANNELDDQHALAYLLLNGETFNVRGITVNATPSGGAIRNHYDEALRIMKLCKLENTIPLYSGADANFEDIEKTVQEPEFDGHAAVNFIIEEALAHTAQPLILIPVGKLTNIALALKKAPEIADHVRIVWLGSNYPEPGEYNQDSDIPAMNYVLTTEAPFEMVTVRYGDSSGTDAIKITQKEINERMPRKGPEITDPISGRHGGTYRTFGDYSVSLFEHIDYYNDARERALFDLAAVAIVKNPAWAASRMHACPVFREGAWVEQPGNERKITIWENFNSQAIINDLFATLDDYVFATR